MSDAIEAAKIVRRIGANVDWPYLIARGTLQRADGRVPVVGISELHRKPFKRRTGARYRAKEGFSGIGAASIALRVCAAILGGLVVAAAIVLLGVAG